MTIKQFDRKYEDKGGVKKLEEMMNNTESLKEISEHFGVVRERVRQWSVDLFGKKYDSRKLNRDKRVNEIKEILGKAQNPDEFRGFLLSLRKSNKYYLDEALKQLAKETPKV